MSIGQLQGLIAQCQNLSYLLTRTQINEQQHPKRTQQQLLKTIKERRMEIAKLKYELKHNMSKNYHKKGYHKRVWDLQRDVKNQITLNEKISDQYYQVSGLCTNMKTKIVSVDERINKIIKEINLSQKYQVQLAEDEELEEKYLQLGNLFEHQKVIGRDIQERYKAIQKIKQAEILAFQREVNQSNQKFTDIDFKIKVQRELIALITDNQNTRSKRKTEIDSTQVQIMNAKAQNAFQKIEELTPFEKVEVQDIFRKKLDAKKEEDWNIGRIVNQQHRNQRNRSVIEPNYGRIVRLKSRQKINFTALSKKSQPKTEPQQHDETYYNRLLGRSQRVAQLQRNKRIRTRQTQMRRFSEIYKNALHNSSQSQPVKEIITPKSIVEIYEELRKEQLSNRKKIGNIEIIKLMKKGNRKKIIKGEKGEYELNKLT